MVGKTDFDFFTDEHAQQAFADEQEVIRTGRPIVGKEEKETWPDGHVTWVSTTKEPLRDEAGNIIGTFGLSRDITEHKKSEDELTFAYLEVKNSREELIEALDNLKKSHEQLKAAQLQLIQAEKLQSVGRLAAGIAHEVKNPLAIITSGLDYLATELVPRTRSLRKSSPIPRRHSSGRIQSCAVCWISPCRTDSISATRNSTKSLTNHCGWSNTRWPWATSPSRAS